MSPVERGEDRKNGPRNSAISAVLVRIYTDLSHFR
jgi:hypothetical protein